MDKRKGVEVSMRNGSGRRLGVLSVAIFASALCVAMVPNSAKADSFGFGFGTGGHGSSYLSFSFGSPYGYASPRRQHQNFHYDQARQQHNNHDYLNAEHGSYHYWYGNRNSYQHRGVHRQLNRTHRNVDRHMQDDHYYYHSGY